MTEPDWLSCTDPTPLLDFVRNTATERKLRLFACSCRRRIERWLFDYRSRFAIQVTEQFVDGLISEESFRDASEDAYLPVGSPRQHSDAGHRVCLWYAARAATDGGKQDPGDAAQFVSYAAAAGFATTNFTWSDRRWDKFLFTAFSEMHGPLRQDRWEEFTLTEAPYELPWNAFEAFPSWTAERKHQADLVRHLFGDVFRPCPQLESWPASVIRLADAQYHGGSAGLPLYDALLEAGHPELAEHFKPEGLHPKGCWALDRILGKE